MDLLLFVLISLGLIAVPGPNVLVIVSTSIACGRTRGLQTVVGTSLAMAIQLLVVAFATASLVSFLTQGLIWIKWLGVAYLLWLALRSFIAIGQPKAQSISGTGSFGRGFLVSLTNPKTMLFFSAFIPQFVSADAAYLTQVAILSTIFWILAVTLDTAYALLSGKLNAVLTARNLDKYQHGAAGLLYLGAGAGLAATRNG